MSNNQDKTNETIKLERFLTAVANLDIEEIKKNIIGVPINIANNWPLRYSIIRNNLEVVKLLVENGANINYDIFLESIEYINKEIFKLLLDNNKDESVLDGRLLLTSIENDKTELLQILVEYNSIINENSYSLAITKNNLEIFTILFNKRIDDLTNEEIFKYLRSAILSWNLDISTFILNTNDKLKEEQKITIKQINELLPQVIETGYADIIDLLIEKGGDKSLLPAGYFDEVQDGGYYKKYIKYKLKYLNLNI